jgi:glyoxylase-like metal-dependent hydrolase (beta-lactamase superfamily II)
MIFRQLFEPVSSTYTYLLGCQATGQALLIDPVMPTWQRDLKVLGELELKLVYTVETHIHADHITSAVQLRREAGSRTVYPEASRVSCADLELRDGEALKLGEVELKGVHTPGHTDDHFAYVLDDRVFSGDALLIDGCGRTDFQNGDAATLYRSVREKLFTLAPDTLLYPAHDYQQRRVSSIGQERARNPRLGGDRSLEQFVQIMSELNLPYPKFIDYAVPGNRACGVCPPDLTGELQRYCRKMEESPQG